MSKRRQYNMEFKREAVKLAQSSTKSVPKVADDLGVSYQTLINWIEKAMAASSDSPSSKKTCAVKPPHVE